MLVLAEGRQDWLSSAAELDLTKFLGSGGAGADRIVARDGRVVRLHIAEDASIGGPLAVALPLDDLIEVRLAALEQFVAAVRGRAANSAFADFSRARQARLRLALRALDAKLDEASYRQIAKALFGPAAVPARAWKTHDLRDRTIRLVRYGLELMRGGYRHLMRHPFRRRP